VQEERALRVVAGISVNRAAFPRKLDRFDLHGVSSAAPRTNQASATHPPGTAAGSAPAPLHPVAGPPIVGTDLDGRGADG
jgi:hypothetical protein